MRGIDLLFWVAAGASAATIQQKHEIVDAERRVPKLRRASRFQHLTICLRRPVAKRFSNPFTKNNAYSGAAAPGLPAEIQTLTPRYFEGSQRVKVRYGPFTIPSVNQKNMIYFLEKEAGMFAKAISKVRKPCDECMITSMTGGLEYSNGTSANIDTGAWLHHLVLMADGPGKEHDVVCPARKGERFFSSGNERTQGILADLDKKTLKSGYYIKSGNFLNMRVELMNMDPIDKPVYVTIDYEFMPGAPAPGWMNTKALWLDVTDCGSSDTDAVNDAAFMLSSNPWKSTVAGTMLSVGM
jgi:hypothetical protein